MSYGYSGYGGYAGRGYGYPPGQPRPGYPPGQPRPGFPPQQQQPPGGYQPAPGFPPQQGYQQPGGYQQQPPGYGMPGYRPPVTTQSQPQGYTPAPGPGGYAPAPTGYAPAAGGYMPPPPTVSAGHAPTVRSGNMAPPMYTPSRPAPGLPATQRPDLPTCVIPATFPELQAMSKEDLQQIVDSDDALVEYFENRDDIKGLIATRQKMVEKNEELAVANLSLKPELEEKQQELIELYAELESQRNELNELQQQQQTLANHYAPHNILTRLKIAASEVEEESEAIAENFLNGDIVIEDFLKTYIPKKTLCHSRRAKEEKMEKMGI